MPPVFIVVCNNTSTSKLVYDFISGFVREERWRSWVQGRFELFRNYDEYGDRLARPRTLLIDSEQLESGDALDKEFRTMAADEIERFRRDLVQRTGDQHAGEKISAQDLLREVMNTVGKRGQLGESIRCVVSVSMLTEGWDANTVTHILGVRAFGTQLLCEQVVGRALRRQSYDLNEEGLLQSNTPTCSASRSTSPPSRWSRQPTSAAQDGACRGSAARPRRARNPVPAGRRLSRRVARGTPDREVHRELGAGTDPRSGRPVDHQEPGHHRRGRRADLDASQRHAAVDDPVPPRTHGCCSRKFRDPGEDPKLYLFSQLKRIAREWLDGGYLRCTGGTYPAQLIYQDIADRACERIKAAITESMVGEHPIKAVLDPYNPTGSTAHVRFDTSKTTLWQTDHRLAATSTTSSATAIGRPSSAAPPRRTRASAPMSRTRASASRCRICSARRRRNTCPTSSCGSMTGTATTTCLNLVVEIKGYRGEDAKDKANTMDAYWVPGVNNLGTFGRWAFAEFKESVYAIAANFDALIERAVASRAE